MATRLTKQEIFDRGRAYLDTDELNFPNPLCDMLLRRLWFQAVAMEREWRFLQKSGTVAVVAGTALVPFSFLVASTASVPGLQLQTVRWGVDDLWWCEYRRALRTWGDTQGAPQSWSELNQGLQRELRLFPIPSIDGTLAADFTLEPAYPDLDTATFADLPAEFDDALVEGLLAEMYMREEDPDLYDSHRQMFLEQMGAIRNRWRFSSATPFVVAGKARVNDPGTSGFSADGAYTLPVAP